MAAGELQEKVERAKRALNNAARMTRVARREVAELERAIANHQCLAEGGLAHEHHRDTVR